MHQIHYETASENCDKRKVEASLDAICETESDWGAGLPSPIQWKNLLFNSYDEARQYIEDHDSSYAQMAVKYRSFPKLVKSKKYEDIKSRLSDFITKYNELNNAFHFRNHASAFIGCKKCGSKISRDYLRSNFCPICHCDLRPSSTLTRIQSLKDKVQELQNALKAEETKLQAKQIKSSEIRWLIKIEYHC